MTKEAIIVMTNTVEIITLATLTFFYKKFLSCNISFLTMIGLLFPEIE